MGKDSLLWRMGFVSSKPRELCQMVLQEEAHTGVDAGRG